MIKIYITNHFPNLKVHLNMFNTIYVEPLLPPIMVCFFLILVILDCEVKEN